MTIVFTLYREVPSAEGCGGRMERQRTSKDHVEGGEAEHMRRHHKRQK
jgi:hypothetical protein